MGPEQGGTYRPINHKPEQVGQLIEPIEPIERLLPVYLMIITPGDINMMTTVVWYGMVWYVLR